jgi:hypothetical protein
MDELMGRRHGLLPLLLAGSVFGVGCKPTPPTAERTTDPVWKLVGTWAGHGNAQLETFPIERFTWRVRWETNNESPPGTGTFHLTANSGDSGRVLADVVDVHGVGKDVAYITELPHRYYLVVTSAGVDWTVTAEETVLR